MTSEEVRDQYTFFGVVHPERANVNISKVVFQIVAKDAGLDGTLTMWIQTSQITAQFVPNEKVSDPYTLKNYVEDSVRAAVDALGYHNGCGYDIEIIQMVDSHGSQPIIFGVGISVLEGVTEDAGIELSDIFSLFRDRRGTYLQRCFADLREAIRSPMDTGFFCYRGIEGLQQFFRVEKNLKDKEEAWECFREELNVNRSTINYVKQLADPRRHGGAVYVSDSDRSEIFVKTWDIVNKFIAYAQQGYGDKE